MAKPVTPDSHHPVGDSQDGPLAWWLATGVRLALPAANSVSKP
jgi:hypothetical protein